MNFDEYFNKAMASFQEGKFSVALENFEAALKFQPNNADLQEMVAQLKAQVNLTSQAAQTLVNEAKSRADVMEGIYGIKLEDITDIDKIITEYRQNPHHDSTKEILAEAYYIRGLMFQSKDDYVQAVKDYSESIKNNPFPLAFLKRGLANMNIRNYENYDQAIEDFKKADLDEAELNKHLANVYMECSFLYYENHDYANAAANCAKVLELNPNHNNARELLDMAKAELGK